MNAFLADMLAQAGRAPQAQPYGLLRLGWVYDKVRYVTSLVELHEIWAIVLVLAGIIYLLCGWKIFKHLVTLNAVILGAWGGLTLASAIDGQNLRVIGAIAGGLLLGVLAWRMLKAAVSLMGALAGAFAGYGLWCYAAELVGRPALADYAWAGALLGMVTFGLLALLVFKFIIMLLTSYQGSVMAISGLLALMVKPYAFHERLSGPVLNNPHLLPILFLVPTFMGFCYQYTASASKAKKKPGGG